MQKTIGNKSFRFSKAITRLPSARVTQGLRTNDIGTPDVVRMRSAHAQYCDALRSTGAEVVVLDPCPAFPDSVFVEDTALCLPDGAVLMRPGAPSRLGEVDEIAPTIEASYGDCVERISDGFIEGGDILTTGSEILVGLSARTDRQGVEALRQMVARWDYSLRIVQTPPDVLHFKTDCSLIDEETILSTRRLATSGCFEGYRVLLVPDGEEPAANAIRFNNIVIMSEGYPRTTEMLDRAGYHPVKIDNHECAKIDGGMSCLSLRFSLPS